MKKLTMVGSVLVSSFAAFAQYDESDGYVRLKTSDSFSGTKVSSWNQVGNWDLVEFCATTNYFIPSGMFMWPPDGSSTETVGAWKGGKMVVAGYLYIRSSRGTSLPRFDDEGITFLGGSYLYGNRNAIGLLNSKVTIAAPVDNPFEARSNPAASGNYSGTYYFSDTVFKSEEGVDAAVRFRTQDETELESATFYIDACNFSQYSGTLTAVGAKTILKPRSNAGGLNFAGSFVVMSNAVAYGAEDADDWAAYTTLPVGSLKLCDGGSLHLWSKNGEVRPCLEVSKSLSVEDVASLKVDGVRAFTWDDVFDSNVTLKVAHLTGDAVAACQLPSGEFPLPVAGDGTDPVSVLKDWRYAVVSDGEGGKDVLVAHTNKIVWTVKADPSGASKDLDPNEMALSTDHPQDFWSSEPYPNPDSTADYVMRSHAKIYAPVNLPNATVTLLQKGNIYWNGTGASLNVKELNLVDCGTIHRYSSSGNPYVMPISGGRLNLIGTVEQKFLGGAAGRGFDIFSQITGRKTLSFGSNADKLGTISLLGDNSDFHGRLVFGAGLNVDDTSVGALKTYLSDSRNWGGIFTQDDDVNSAITIRNLTQVFVTNDVAFVGEAVRNMSISNGVIISVSADKTLTLGNKLTCDGTIRKIDAGTLEMSGSMVLQPYTESAALQVEAGALKVSSATACDGFDIAFAEGTKLVIPASLQRGLCNVKSAKPLTINTTSGILPVEIVGFDEKPEDDVEVTVLTLNKDAAANIGAEKFKFVRTSACKVIKFEKREVGDSVAYVATVSGKRGFRIIFR